MGNGHSDGVNGGGGDDNTSHSSRTAGRGTNPLRPARGIQSREKSLSSKVPEGVSQGQNGNDDVSTSSLHSFSLTAENTGTRVPVPPGHTPHPPSRPPPPSGSGSAHHPSPPPPRRRHPEPPPPPSQPHQLAHFAETVTPRMQLAHPRGPSPPQPESRSAGHSGVSRGVGAPGTSTSQLGDLLSMDDCSVSVAIRRVSSLNRSSVGGSEDGKGSSANSSYRQLSEESTSRGNGSHAAGAGHASPTSGGPARSKDTHSEEGKDLYHRPPVSTEEARSLFELIFSPADGQLECVQSDFISLAVYSELSEFFNPFLENDPLRKKWFVDNTMRVVIGRDSWRSTREPEIGPAVTKEQIRQLIKLRKDYTDLLREKLLEMADVVEGPVHRRRKTSFREQVAMFNASKEAARNANAMKTQGEGSGPSSDSPSTTWGNALSESTSTRLGATTSQLQGTEYDVLMARLMHASATSFDCYNLVASRLPTKFFSQIPTAYWFPETPVVWDTVGCRNFSVTALAQQSFFVPLNRRVELFHEQTLRKERDRRMGLSSPRAANFTSPNYGSRAVPGAGSGPSSLSSDNTIDSAAKLFSSVRNLGLVLTTASSSMVLQVLIDLADAIKMRQNFRSLKQQAKELNMKLEDLIGKDALPKRHYTGDAGPNMNEWKEFFMVEEMTLPVLAQLLVRRFYEETSNKKRMRRLRKDYMNIFAVLEAGSKGGEDFIPTRTLGSIVLKLMFLLGGGQRSIEADDRRVPTGSRQSTDDLSLAHMLNVPVLNYICWVACLLGMPVMSPKGSLLQKRRERPLSFMEADEIAGVMRVLFQEVGALPSGNACPRNFSEWLPLFPLYAVNTEGKRTLMYLYSVQASAAKPLPLVIQKDMALQSFAAIITENMKSFGHARRSLEIKKTVEEVNRANEASVQKILQMSATAGQEERSTAPMFEPDKLLSYLWLPTMTTGYAKMHGDRKLKAKKAKKVPVEVAMASNLEKIKAAGTTTPSGGTPANLSPTRSQGETGAPDGRKRPSPLPSTTRPAKLEIDRDDPCEPMNYKFDGPNRLLMMGNSAGSSSSSSSESSLAGRGSGLQKNVSSPNPSGSSPASRTSQPLTAQAIAALRGKRANASGRGTPGVTEDDDNGTDDTSDTNSSCSTLLDPNMNVDAYTCVSPAAQLYLRCANEAIVKRHKSTELTPFVDAELYRSVSALQARQPEIYAEMQTHLNAVTGKTKFRSRDSVLVLRWQQVEPMVTFQPGDVLSITVERPQMATLGSSRYFSNMSRRGSQSYVGSVNFGNGLEDGAGLGATTPRSTSTAAYQGPRATRRHSVTIDAADPSGHSRGGGGCSGGNGSTCAVSKKGKGSAGTPHGAIPLTASEVGQGGYWKATTQNAEDSMTSLADTTHSGTRAGSGSGAFGSAEDRQRGAMALELTVSGVSDPVKMRQQHRANEVVLLVKASTSELPEASKVLSVGHVRATMSPFFYLEGDNSMCWTNTRLIAAIVAAAHATSGSSGRGTNGGEPPAQGGGVTLHPCGYTGEQLKRLFYSIGVLIANAITNAVFFSVPMAPLCFWLFKKAMQTGDHSFRSFAWLEPCDGNLLSPPMVLNAAFDIMNLSDKAYLDFLNVRGFARPENLVFALIKRDPVPGLAIPRGPTTLTGSPASFRRMGQGGFPDDRLSTAASSPGAPTRLSVSRTSGRDGEAHSTGGASGTTSRLILPPVAPDKGSTLMKEYLNAIDAYNRTGPADLLNSTAGLPMNDRKRSSASPAGAPSLGHSSSGFSSASQSGRGLPSLPTDPVQVRRALESLPSREDYISLYLVNEIVWGSACRNGFGDDVKELWGWMAKGFMTSPIARSPLMTHCCSRVIREVLCMPISGRAYTSEG